MALSSSPSGPPTFPTAPPPSPQAPEPGRGSADGELQKKIFYVALTLMLIVGLGAILSSKNWKGEETSPPEPVVEKEVVPSKRAIRRRGSGGWTSLLAAGLDDWDLWLGRPHETVSLPGSPPVAKGKLRPPLGANDPKSVFSIIEMEGKRTLRISGEINGGIMTKEAYGNYHFSARFKWGEKQWPAALSKEKDSGILIHCFGDPGERYGFWRHAIEYQIRGWTAGDLWVMGTQAMVPVRIEERPNGTEIATFSRGWPLQKITKFAYRDPSSHFRKSDWNTAEIYALGTEAVFTLNGIPTSVLLDMRMNFEGFNTPLSDGEIYLQSAGAEIFFQDVKIQELDAFPEDLELILESTRPKK